MTMTRAQTMRLLHRGGLGATPREIARWQKLKPLEAVARLLSAARTHKKTTTSPPGWVGDPPPDVREVRKNPDTFQELRRERSRDLVSWWWGELCATRSPLTERMTLFWHNHFTSSLEKVRWAPLMYQQNALLRKHALGSFRELLHRIAKDPAMLIYLDGHHNHRDDPNENFARELLELFTLGEGHYSEKDIKEAARSLTGWRVNRATGGFRFAKGAYDSGTKTFLGKTGRWSGTDIVDILLENPRTAEYIVERMWRAFLAAEPDRTAVQRIARRFGRTWDIGEAVGAILLSDAFLDDAEQGRRIKSPVDIIVGTLRTLDVRVEEPFKLAKFGAALGQNLMSPPNVKGWPGGRHWISAHTLLLRRKGLKRAIRSPELRERFRGGEEAVAAWMGVRTSDRRKLIDGLAPALLATEPVGKINTDNPRRALRSIVLDPAFQLV